MLNKAICFLRGHKWRIGFFYDHCGRCKDKRIGTMSADEFLEKIGFNKESPRA